MTTQHEYFLFSLQALNNGATLPRMSGRKDLFGQPPPALKGDHFNDRLGLDFIHLFIF